MWSRVCCMNECLYKFGIEWNETRPHNCHLHSNCLCKKCVCQLCVCATDRISSKLTSQSNSLKVIITQWMISSTSYRTEIKSNLTNVAHVETIWDIFNNTTTNTSSHTHKLMYICIQHFSYEFIRIQCVSIQAHNSLHERARDSKTVLTPFTMPYRCR